jgi:hypothetical protein
MRKIILGGFFLICSLALSAQKNTLFLFNIQYNQDISNRSTFPNLILKDLSFALEGVYNFSSK